MSQQKKISLFVPDELLLRAQKATGAGISKTIRRGLELLAASDSFDELRKLRGKVKFTIKLAELRKDR